MKRRTPNPFHQQSTRVGDYRLLGLAWGESDIVKIRNSVTASSNDLRKKVKPRGTHEGLDRRTKVALAGYRLLDPRFRSQLYDRVQLSCIVYRELDELPRDIESSDRLPLLTDKLPTLDTQSEPKLLSHASTSDQACDFQSSSQFSPNSDCASNDKFESSESAFRAMPFEWQGLDQESSPLEDAREIVRLLNEPKLAENTKSNKISRWIRAARSVGSLCRRVRCAVL
ncbi:MAG: hypothetical protein NTW52_06205 [Planctomycetota bacterium]|nr:hypothetical protein [Planctomycetota bacterium]